MRSIEAASSIATLPPPNASTDTRQEVIKATSEVVAPYISDCSLVEARRLAIKAQSIQIEYELASSESSRGKNFSPSAVNTPRAIPIRTTGVNVR